MFQRLALLTMGVAPLFALGCNGLSSTSGRHELPNGVTQQVKATAPGNNALASVATASQTGRLFADVDRNGKIDANDDAGRDTWTGPRGAIFVYNNDDDDGDHVRDSDDNKLNGADDKRTLTRLVVGQLSSNPLTVKLLYSPPKAPVRVFKVDTQTGSYNEVIAPSTGDTGYTIPNGEIVGGEVNLFVEATGPITKAWDGVVTFTLDVKGSVPSSDTLQMKCAPLIYTDNTRPAITVYAMVVNNAQNAPNKPFITALTAGLQSQNVQFYPVDETKYQGDRWVQDDLQTGFHGYVDASGNYTSMDVYNRLERGRGLGTLIPDELMSKNKGHTYAGPGQQEGCNYGGNFEVIPPHDEGTVKYPFGRVYRGGGDAGSVTGQVYSRHMNQEEVDLVDAQGMQGPSFEISSEWLGVGHVDEFSMAIPDKNSVGGHAFKIAWASPTLAMQALKALQAKGMGSATAYTGKTDQNGNSVQKTVDQILNDAALQQYNSQVQARLDSNKQKLITGCGLSAADFVEFPVYYEIMQGAGQDMGISQNPGSQNCIPVTDRLYVPDPTGPQDGGKDVWQAQIDAALQPLGITAVFVDVFDSYHELAGEAHCGSNVIYTPYTMPWWQR